MRIVWNLLKICSSYASTSHNTSEKVKERSKLKATCSVSQGLSLQRSGCFKFVKFVFQFGKGGGVPANTQPTVSVAAVPPQPPAEKKQHSTSKLQVGDVNRK